MYFLREYFWERFFERAIMKKKIEKKYEKNKTPFGETGCFEQPLDLTGCSNIQFLIHALLLSQ